MKYTRQDFLRMLGVGMAVGATTPALAYNTSKKSATKPANNLKLGIASYTLKEFNLEQAVEMTKRLGLPNIALKSLHLPMETSPDERKAMAIKVRDAGLNLYGLGVIYMKTEEEVSKAFEYAKQVGVKMIIGVPSHNLLSFTEKKVKDYDIKLAIHNHGPGDEVYPSPESVYEKIKNLDKRIGLCMDIGHTQRIGLDPSANAIKYKDRLYDIHIKDVTGSTEKDTPLEIGRGVIDIPKFLQTLQKIKYNGVVSFEYEKDAKDPMPGLAESVGYVKGVLAVI